MLPAFRSIMTTRMIVVGLLALTIIVAAGIWAAADSLERSAVKVGVRRCLSNMVAAGC